MPTKPVLEYLSRNQEKGLHDLLSYLSLTIEEVVNYSSRVFSSVLDKISLNYEDIPIILMYRNIFEILDAISTLIRESCIVPCSMLLRSALETFLGLLYLLEKDSEVRGRDCLVWERHQKLKSLRRFDPKDSLHVQFIKAKERDVIGRGLPIPDVSDIETQLEKIKQLFKIPELQNSVDEYERYQNNHNGEIPKHWYSLRGGPASARKLASHLNFPYQYEVLYSSWSKAVHGTDIMDNFSSETPNKASFMPLRSPSSAPEATTIAINLGLSSIRNLTAHYIPHLSKENAAWYRKEVQAANEKIAKLKITVL
jgi:hypothetical protein